jgi:hypothetical protein
MRFIGYQAASPSEPSLPAPRAAASDRRTLGQNGGFSNITVFPPVFNAAAGETLKVTYSTQRTAFMLVQAFKRSGDRFGDFVYNKVRFAGSNSDEWDGRYGPFIRRIRTSWITSSG